MVNTPIRTMTARCFAVSFALLLSYGVAGLASAQQVTAVLPTVTVTGTSTKQEPDRVPPSTATFIAAGFGQGPTSRDLQPTNRPRQLKSPPTSDNNSKLNCDASTTKPVMLTTGEKYLPQVDFESISEYGISLTRTYRSQQLRGRGFGGKWMFSLDGIELTWAGTTCDVDHICYPVQAPPSPSPTARA